MRFMIFIFMWIALGLLGMYVALIQRTKTKMFINIPMILFLFISPFIPLVAKIFEII